MDEFQNQLDKSLYNALDEFNSTNDLISVRETYVSNFQKIKNYIGLTNERNSIEDIIAINPLNNSAIMNRFLLIKEINRGIKEGAIYFAPFCFMLFYE